MVLDQLWHLVRDLHVLQASTSYYRTPSFVAAPILPNATTHFTSAVEHSKRWMLLVMEKGFLPLLDIWGLILGMLVTFSYAQVAMYVFGLCNIRPVKRSIMVPKMMRQFPTLVSIRN